MTEQPILATDNPRSEEPKPIRLVVGLGNPGLRYAKTRHNIGFNVIDKLLSKHWCDVTTREYSDCHLYSTCYRAQTLYCIKPMTYMNNSGEAVAAFAEKTGICSEQILVVYDCLDLNLGRIRVRQKGSSGGHNGVNSLIQQLNTQKFPRIRCGIGRPDHHQVIDYVLSTWDNDEVIVFNEVVETAAKAVMSTIDDGIVATMNAFNCWQVADMNS